MKALELVLSHPAALAFLCVAEYILFDGIVSIINAAKSVRTMSLGELMSIIGEDVEDEDII